MIEIGPSQSLGKKVSKKKKKERKKEIAVMEDYNYNDYIIIILYNGNLTYLLTYLGYSESESKISVVTVKIQNQYKYQ